MRKELQQILTQLRELLPSIKEQYNVKEIEVFGSYVRSEENSSSDLDILVTYSKTPSLLQFVNLKNYLSDSLGLEVDLIMRESVKPNLSEKIFKETLAV